MNLQFFCPRWGSEAQSWDDFMTAVKAAGYDGVEYGIPATATSGDLDEVWNKAERHGLRMIAQHYDTYDANYSRHCEAYQGWLEKLKPYPVVKIDSQTGKDFFTLEQNSALIGLAARFTEETGVVVYHETHRNKFPFAAHVTKIYLQELPDLKITLDVSHWVNVAESFLEDQPEAMSLAIQRTGHIHARVGYPEGPQVPDPRAPEWQQALQVHLNWWDQVVRRHHREGLDQLTITPEFGPYPYLVELPFTRQPVSSQWDVNVWMMQLLRERYTAARQ
jgi:sugar phosphate isomerase/epimerase